MEEFKVIKEESYESIAGYLNKICQYTNIIYPLAFVTYNGRKYMITEVEDNEKDGHSYAIVYDDGYELRLFGTFYEDESFALVDDSINKSYRIGNNNVITTYDNNNRFEETFYSSKTIQTRPQDYFYYSQLDPLNRREVHMTYIISEAHTPERAVPYIRHRNPDNIMINKAGLFLNHPKDYGCFNDRYYRYLRLNDDYVRALEFIKSYRSDEMRAYINSLGFNSYIPDELIELYMGTHNNAKVLRKVTDKYRENTNK